MNTTPNTMTTQPQLNTLQAVTCEDGSICLMSQEQIDAMNAATLQQAARITGWDASRNEFRFAPQPAHTRNTMSLQGARAAAKRALQRCESAAATTTTNKDGNYDTTNTSNTRPNSRFLIPSRRPQARPSNPSPPPSYVSGSHGQGTSCAAWVESVVTGSRPKDDMPRNDMQRKNYNAYGQSSGQKVSIDTPASRASTASGLNSGLWIFLLILFLVCIVLYVGKKHFAQEPATHERLGRLLMEGVCRDMSVKGCMELVKAGRVDWGDGSE